MGAEFIYQGSDSLLNMYFVFCRLAYRGAAGRVAGVAVPYGGESEERESHAGQG